MNVSRRQPLVRRSVRNLPEKNNLCFRCEKRSRCNTANKRRPICEERNESCRRERRDLSHMNQPFLPIDIHRNRLHFADLHLRNRIQMSALNEIPRERVNIQKQHLLLVDLQQIHSRQPRLPVQSGRFFSQSQRRHPLSQQIELSFLVESSAYRKRALFLCGYQGRSRRILLSEQLVEEIDRKRSAEARYVHSPAMELLNEVQIGGFFALFQLQRHRSDKKILLSAAGEQANFALHVGVRIERQDPVDLSGNVGIDGQHDRLQLGLCVRKLSNTNSFFGTRCRKT